MQTRTTIRSRALGFALAISVAVLWPPAMLNAGVVPSFQGLGDLPGSGFLSQANDTWAHGAVAAGGSSAVAGAFGQAWFTLEGTPPAGVSATQGPGQTLVITKPPGPGQTVLTIGYNVTTTIGPMAGWAITLNSPDPNMTAGGLAWLGAGYTSPNFDFGTTPNAGGVLVKDFAQVSFSLTGSQGLVGTFDLNIDKAPDGPNLRQIFGTFGATAQADASGTWYGRVGANPYNTFGSASHGFNGYDANYAPRPSLPIIEINNVPEPTILALLGVGVVCLIRHRRLR